MPVQVGHFGQTHIIPRTSAASSAVVTVWSHVRFGMVDILILCGHVIIGGWIVVPAQRRAFSPLNRIAVNGTSPHECL